MKPNQEVKSGNDENRFTAGMKLVVAGKYQEAEALFKQELKLKRIDEFDPLLEFLVFFLEFTWLCQGEEKYPEIAKMLVHYDAECRGTFFKLSKNLFVASVQKEHEKITETLNMLSLFFLNTTSVHILLEIIFPIFRRLPCFTNISSFSNFLNLFCETVQRGFREMNDELYEKGLWASLILKMHLEQYEDAEWIAWDILCLQFISTPEDSLQIQKTISKLEKLEVPKQGSFLMAVDLASAILFKNQEAIQKILEIAENLCEKRQEGRKLWAIVSQIFAPPSPEEVPDTEVVDVFESYHC